MRKLWNSFIIIAVVAVSMLMVNMLTKKDAGTHNNVVASNTIIPVDTSSSEVIPAPLRTVNVTTSDTLKSAIANTIAGDHIVLANGSYSLDKITATGTGVSPIVIEADNNGMAFITSGAVTLDGCSNVIVSGLNFTTDQTIQIKNSVNCRFTRNTLKLTEKSTELDWIMPLETSSHIRIDHNLFDDKTTKGNFISFSGTKGVCKYTIVDHNYFKNTIDKGVNGTEAIRIGLGAISTSNGYVTVEYNLFEDCDGDAEIISSKSCDNVIRYNTIKNSTGSISLRQGARCQVYNNTILGNNKTVGKSTTGGIKVYGQDHSIHDNSNPKKSILESILKVVRNKGSAVVFNEKFQKARLKELAELYTEYRPVVENIINRIVDLAGPFTGFEHYNPLKNGSCSI